jgi:hypothetical protein
MKTWEEMTKLKKSEIIMLVFYILNGILDITTAIITKNKVWILCGLLWIIIALIRYFDLKIIKGNEAIIDIQEVDSKIKEEIIDVLMNETTVEIEINKIKIPEHFSKPNPKKLQQKFKYYKENHKFESQIVIDLDYNLVDGYTSYLIAKNYNKTTVIAKLKRNKTGEEE